MKKLFTLAAAGAMAATALTAQAQITVDGTLNATEIGAANSGRYVRIGQFTNPRGFGDWGLLSLYAANSGSKVYFFVAGTVQNDLAGANTNRNSFQLYIDVPGVAGGADILGGTAASGTSFEKMSALMDFAPDMAIGIRGDGLGTLNIDGVVYVPTANAGEVRGTDKVLAPLLAVNGTALTIPAAATAAPYTRFAGARVAYRNSSDGKVTTNPGAATGGVAGSFGWEFELDRAAMGAGTTGTPQLTVFAVQNNGGGDYVSSDFIPQATPAITSNSGNAAANPNFTTIGGTQAAPFTLSVLGLKQADDQRIAMSVFPNPAAGEATVSYQVLNKSQNVNIVLTDLMGRTVRTLRNGNMAAGAQRETVSTQDVAAGTYLVKVQVGDMLATRKVVLL
ncbi:T9SS type A sorting domain-containing protein [Hymenobacter canadensis]|uniref:T9SS type A sorting domain-containing protein n=1 Tax=Hymenobacter canadensis TaxID=2999067 RepID=A0ABY7LSV6_9BACT|nr:T9SS type A sorting domain-containing protein [Hymenobacter canadensis]WBA42556.1 T9SS type A sorting domain-containing protein [Hymenobacter canadensis]